MTTTDTHSDGGGATYYPVHGVHAAPVHDPDAPTGGTHRALRAIPRSARDTATSGADQGQHAGLTVSDIAGPVVDRLGDAATHLSRALGERFSPPDWWSKPMAAMSQVWAHARHGEWTTRTGAPRVLGCVYAFFVAIPVGMAARYGAWTSERPSRFFASAVLGGLLVQFPPLSWAVTGLAWALQRL